jgi:hypothetical protein
MQFIVALFEGTETVLEGGGDKFERAMYMNADGQFALAAFFVSYALEFLCLTVAKIMVLDRLVKFAIGALAHARGSAKISSWHKRVVVLRRLLMACVVVGNMAGLGGNIAAAVFAVRADVPSL